MLKLHQSGAKLLSSATALCGGQVAEQVPAFALRRPAGACARSSSDRSGDGRASLVAVGTALILVSQHGCHPQPVAATVAASRILRPLETVGAIQP